jgi:hypothetical protein
MDNFINNINEAFKTIEQNMPTKVYIDKRIYELMNNGKSIEDTLNKLILDGKGDKPINNDCDSSI